VPQSRGLFEDESQRFCAVTKGGLLAASDLETGRQQRDANFAPPSDRPGNAMTEPTQGADPHVGIFWLVQTMGSEAKLLAAGCPLDQAEPYGDCLTYGAGHYE
jgi:hypothetical protein